MENVKRKITYRLYLSKRQVHEMSNILSLHQKLYNAALEQRINVYKSKKISLSYFDQARELTELRKFDEDYKKLNAQSSQVTLKRLDLAFKNFFRRIKSKESKAGFPRFKAHDRFSGWGYATHGDGWRLLAGEKSKHGYLRLSGVGHIKIRGQGKYIGIPKTCEIQHKQGKWYASVTLECSPTRKSGENAVGIDWGLESFVTVVNDKGTSSMIANHRFLKKELKHLEAVKKINLAILVQ